VTSIPSDGEKTSENLSSPRNFPNWIQAYREWAEPSTDAPLSFIAWGALFAIASVIKRKVRIPKSIIGSYEVNPHLFIMYVGPPGLRKTASIENFALPLMTAVPGTNLGPTYFTKETFLTELTTLGDSSCSLVIGEFGELMQKNKPAEMYDFLITLFDGGSKDKLTVSTFKRGNEIAVKPCVNMLAATTRSWISENMSDNAIGGGFSSRVIYVHEHELRDNGALIYRKRLRDLGTDRAEHEAKLLQDLIHISTLQGDFDMTDETEDYINEWYFKHRDIVKKAPEKMHGYYSRKPLMILKLAMIHSIATKDELRIDPIDFDFGVFLMDMNEGSLKEVFAGVGKNEYVLDLDAIVNFVKSNESCYVEQIVQEFIGVGNAEKILELLNTAVVMGDLQVQSYPDAPHDGLKYRFWVP
jgi:hypothetical protein